MSFLPNQQNEPLEGVTENMAQLAIAQPGQENLQQHQEQQVPEPQLAESYRISPEGTLIEFKLRGGLRFSDGSSLTSADVAWSLRRVLLPSTGSVVAEEFLLPAQVAIDTPDKLTVKVHLPKRVVGLEKIFDEIAIEPANRPSEGRVTAGPFVVTDYQRGQYLRLTRNPHYWRRDSAGRQLPLAPAIRLEVQRSLSFLSSWVRGGRPSVESASSRVQLRVGGCARRWSTTGCGSSLG